MVQSWWKIARWFCCYYYQANSIIVWTIKSIVSILAIYFDFVHQLLRLNLIVLWCFLLDGIILLPITAPTRSDENYPVNHCQPTVPRPLSRVCSDFSVQQTWTEHAEHQLPQRPFNERVAIAQQVHSKCTAIKLLLCDLVQCVCWYMNHLQLISSKPWWARKRAKETENESMYSDEVSMYTDAPIRKEYLLYQIYKNVIYWYVPST